MSTTLWRRRPTALWRLVMDDVVILSESEDEVFAVRSGADLWLQLEGPSTLDQLGVPRDLIESLTQRGAV